MRLVGKSPRALRRRTTKRSRRTDKIAKGPTFVGPFCRNEVPSRFSVARPMEPPRDFCELLELFNAPDVKGDHCRRICVGVSWHPAHDRRSGSARRAIARGDGSRITRISRVEMVREDIIWGMRLGLFFGCFYVVVAVAIYVTAGPQAFDAHGVRLTEAIFLYLCGGVLAGAVVGILRGLFAGASPRWA